MALSLMEETHQIYVSWKTKEDPFIHSIDIISTSILYQALYLETHLVTALFLTSGG